MKRTPLAVAAAVIATCLLVGTSGAQTPEESCDVLDPVVTVPDEVCPAEPSAPEGEEPEPEPESESPDAQPGTPADPSTDDNSAGQPLDGGSPLFAVDPPVEIPAAAMAPAPTVAPPPVRVPLASSGLLPSPAPTAPDRAIVDTASGGSRDGWWREPGLVIGVDVVLLYFAAIALHSRGRLWPISRPASRAGDSTADRPA